MRPRVIVLIVLALALVAGLTASLWTSATSGPASQKVAPPRLIPNTDVNPFGANFFLDREVEPWKREKTLEMAREAGIGWAKQHFPWEAIEPRRKGEFTDEQGRSTWRKFDELVSLYEKFGLQIIARLDRPPDWTRQDNRFKQRPPDNFEDYGDFVYEFVKHYRGRIRYIQIWNEPNIFPEWGDQPVDPAAYVELLKIAYRRAKEADPNVYILSAPLAITLEDFPGRRNLSDLIFLEEMYQAGAADYFDILSANAFGMDQPPEAPPSPDVLNFRRVELLRQIMERYGDADKPIWFNEYGWNAAPESFPKDKLIWQRVSELEQAEYTVRGIEYARQHWPWAGVFAIWYFRQVGNIPPNRADYYFRMVDVDFTPRPVYQAIKEAAAGQKVAGAGYFQETNPAVSYGDGWQPVIAPAASGQAVAESHTPGATLRFRFTGDEVDLVTWRGPEAGRLQVRLDGRSVPQLPTDEEGRSYRDLYAAAPEWQVRLPLVRGAGPGVHTLELTVTEEAHPAATGRRCVVDALIIGGTAGNGFPTVLVLTLLAGLGVVVVLLAHYWCHQGTAT